MDSWPKYLELGPDGELVDVSHKLSPRGTLSARCDTTPVGTLRRSRMPPPLDAITASRRDLRASTLLWFKQAFDETTDTSPIEQYSHESSQQTGSPNSTKEPPETFTVKRPAVIRVGSAVSSQYSDVRNPGRRCNPWYWLVLIGISLLGVIAFLSIILGVPNVLNQFLRIELHSLHMANQTSSAFTARLNATVFASAGGFKTSLEGASARLTHGGKPFAAFPIPTIPIRRNGSAIVPEDVVQVFDSQVLASLLQRLLVDQKAAKIQLVADARLRFTSRLSMPVTIKHRLTLPPIIHHLKFNRTSNTTRFGLSFDNPTRISGQFGGIQIALKTVSNATTRSMRSTPFELQQGHNEVSFMATGGSNSSVEASFGNVTVFPGVAASFFVGKHIALQ